MNVASFNIALDNWVEQTGDRLNPVLVKETRQVLHSRQFTGTFFVLLGATWIMSLVGVGSQGDDLQYANAGPQFFQTFYSVLMFCLCFVVPLGVFRSMTSEFVGKTFETLISTPLTADRIIYGKLQSALVQMAIYMSAVAPFLCFTYLLRGIGIFSILFLVFIAFMASLTVSLAAVMFGALGKKSFCEAICLILLLCVGAIAFLSSAGFVTAVNVADVGALVSGLLCFFVVFFYFGLLTLGIAIAQLEPTRPIRHNTVSPRSYQRPQNELERFRSMRQWEITGTREKNEQ